MSQELITELIHHAYEPPAGFESREISERTVPDDFRNRRIHRCWTVPRGPPASGMS